MANGKKKTSSAVTKKGTALPDTSYFDSDDLGVDSIDQEDMVVPRLKICQSMSDVHENTTIKDGQLYNHVSNEVFTDGVELFVLRHWKNDIWFDNERGFKASRVFNKRTGEYEYFGDAEWAKEHEDEAINSHNYFIILVSELASAMKTGDIPMPIVYSASSTAVKYARQLNSKLKANAFARRVPIYGQMVSVTSKLEQFKKGKAFMPVFSYGRLATPEEAGVLKEISARCQDLISKAEAQQSTNDGNAVSEDKGRF